jgi:citrate lyase subunit beta/citryl-CoA lyase
MNTSPEDRAPQFSPRSYLFVPGNRPLRFPKGLGAGADAVILDLEDAVPPPEKAEARAAVEAWLSPAHPVLIRVNGAGTEWHKDDIALCQRPGVAGIVLPKSEDARAVRHVAEMLGGMIGISALIETALGFKNMASLAETNLVQRFLFGSIDFQFDLGIRGDDEELLYFRSQLVLISRLFGLPPPVDGVTAAIGSEEQLLKDAQRARRLGFGGKLCIHPSQVAVVNACFLPSAEERDWACRVRAAMEASGGSAVSVDGKMVDRPIALQAERILANLQEYESRAAERMEAKEPR